MTLEELAGIAGVSTATVSNALSGKGSMTDRTRARIKALASEAAYQPQAAARALATGRRQMIGFVTGPTNLPDDQWTMKVLGGMVYALEERDYHLMLFHAEPAEGVMPAPVLRNAVDALAVGLMGSRAFIEEIMKRGMPLIAVNPREDVPCDSVRFDELDAAQQATRHLIDLGHKRIAYVGSYSTNVVHLNRRRWSGYAQTMKEGQLAVMPGGEAIQDIDERLDGLFCGAGAPPTGLVCFDDEDALLVIRGLHARGLAVPRDTSVVSFDDMDHMGSIIPALTTVGLPFVEMGRRAAGLILERIEKPDLPPQHIMLPGELITRESSTLPRNAA